VSSAFGEVGIVCRFVDFADRFFLSLIMNMYARTPLPTKQQQRSGIKRNQSDPEPLPAVVVVVVVWLNRSLPKVVDVEVVDGTIKSGAVTEDEVVLDIVLVVQVDMASITSTCDATLRGSPPEFSAMAESMPEAKAALVDATTSAWNSGDPRSTCD
jgi:hypothetical protein